MITASLSLWLACKKEPTQSPPAEPLVTTNQLTVSGDVATGGGEVTDDGDGTITAVGLAWSSTNPTPTLADDTTKNVLNGVSFTAHINGLASGSTYYVRAYATNEAGTGYGEVLTINTANVGPEARRTTIEGQANITNKILASFVYFDAEGDAQAPGSYQWYVANDSTSGSGSAIGSATDSIYSITAGDEGKFLRAAITPKAAAGTAAGEPVFTPWIGPVGAELTTATFIYNGEEVTYDVLTSPKTGRKWLDRNLGAKQAATSQTDYLAYGDLFQWGRPADGHQLINWTSETGGTAVSGTVKTAYTSNTPDGSLFVINGNESGLAPTTDWVSPSNMERWLTNPRGPCPIGWRVPSEMEWVDERESEDANSITNLKIVKAGERSWGDGALVGAGDYGYYWSFSMRTHGTSTVVPVYFTKIGGGFDGSIRHGNKQAGHSVRCIKD